MDDATNTLILSTTKTMYDEIKKLTAGCSIGVEGEVRKSPAKGQETELQARKIHLYGWADAEKFLLEIATAFPDDGPTKALAARIAHYRHDPPPPDWDGVYVAKEK